MLEKEFRDEDPSSKIIVLASLIVSLMGGGALAVKIGMQGFPPLKMALFRCILGIIAVGGIGLYYGMSMRMRSEELRRLLLIAALYALHTITLNIGTQLTTASRATIFTISTPSSQSCSDTSIFQMIDSLPRKQWEFSSLSVAFFSPSCRIYKGGASQDTSSAT